MENKSKNKPVKNPKAKTVKPKAENDKSKDKSEFPPDEKHPAGKISHG